MDAGTESLEPAVVGKGPNEFASLATIFVKPKETFAGMAGKPRFWLAFILVIVVLSVATVPIFQSGVIREETIAKMEAKGTPQPQIDATAKFFDSPVGLVFALVGNLIGVPFALLVSAGLLFFMGNLMMGAKLRFPHYVSAVAYASVVGLVDHLVRTGIILAKQTTDVRLGLGNILGDDIGFGGRALDSLTDPLLLWTTAVTAIGVATYARKGFGFGVMAAVPGFVVAILLSAWR